MRRAILLAALVSTHASAQQFDWGNLIESTAAEVVGYYSAEKLYRRGRDAVAIGYVTAVYDADLSSKPAGAPYCVPDGVTNGQLADVVWKYFEEHPSQRHLSAPYLVRMSFRAAYPCMGR